MRRRHSQSVEVDLGTDVFVRKRRHARNDVVVVSDPEVLVLQSDAMVHLLVEVLGRDVVEYPVTIERRWTKADGTYTRRGKQNALRQCYSTIFWLKPHVIDAVALKPG